MHGRGEEGPGQADEDGGSRVGQEDADERGEELGARVFGCGRPLWAVAGE
jgi:hypothetical protein